MCQLAALGKKLDNLEKENENLKQEVKALNKGNRSLRKIYDLALHDITILRKKLFRCTNCKYVKGPDNVDF